jgi:hypothetical protein
MCIERVTAVPGEPLRLNVFASVVSDGRPAADLAADDFQVRIDGAPAAGAVEVSLFAAEDRSLSYVVLIDNSEDLATSLTLVKRAAGVLAEALGFRYQGSLIAYGGSPQVLAGPNAGAAAVSEAAEKVRPVPEGPRLDNGLMSALDILAESPAGRRVLVVFSQGRDAGGLFSREAAWEKAREAGVGVYVIGYGRPGDLADLERMASEACGAAFYAGLPDELLELARRTADLIRGMYVLTVNGPIPADGGPWRRLEASVRLDGQRLTETVAFYHPEAPVEPRRWPAALLGAVLLAVLGAAVYWRRRTAGGKV